MTGEKQALDDLVRQKIEALRPKLLDLSRRNPLIATKLGLRTSSHIRVVDELPDILFYNLSNNQEMRLMPLPAIEDDPRDEQSAEFNAALSNARLVDEFYLADSEKISPDAHDALDKSRALERQLKDRVREQLGMPPRAAKTETNLLQHARNNGITPSYDLPRADEQHEDGRHNDTNIQTLLLPKDLERKLNGLTSKCRTWIQETGINVLHIAYGFLEWSERGETETSFAPIILSSAKMEKRRTKDGMEFWISGTGEEPEINEVLTEKLRIDFGITLPAFDGTSVEEYLSLVAQISPHNVQWRVRRQVVIGVFPSARMAMYHDLDTQTANFDHNDIVQSLLAGSNTGGSSPFADEYNVDQPDIERKVPYLVMDADSSQFSTLVDLADGKSLAVEGPPGTGKSQTIVNAIAAALANGKKVLFVAEKLAALNVVKARLEAVGLGDFLLPLQAERSTREQVMESVRKRIEMRPERVSREYDAKLDHFKKARENLAVYIDILTTEFENTGFSVHEILGRGIATSDRLESVPRDVLDECDIPLECVSVAGLQRLRKLGDEIEEAHAEALCAQPHWQGTQLENPARFTIEEACDLAARAAVAFKRLNDARPALGEIGLSADLPARAVDEIADHLERAIAFKHITPAFIADLLIGNNGRTAKDFLDRCERCQNVRNELARDLSGEPSQDSIEKIKKAQEVCESARLSTLDLQGISKQITEESTFLAKAQSLAAKLKPFIQEHPESAGWRLADIARASALIQQTGRDALLRRSEATGSPSAEQLLREFAKEGRRLLEEKTKLSDQVSFALDIPLDRLSASLACLRTAGAFRAFSGSFREAKRLFRSISTTTAFMRQDAIATLGTLITWKSQEIEFKGNPQIAAMFGVHFKGIATDFDVFDRLAGFYDHLNTNFSKAESRSLRRFLRSADIESLDDFPDIPNIEGSVTYEGLLKTIGELQTEVATLKEAVAALQQNLLVLRAPEAVSPGRLRIIADGVQSFLDERAALDQHDCVHRHGAYFTGWKTKVEDLRPVIAWALEAGDSANSVAIIFEREQFEPARGVLKSVCDANRHAQAALSLLCASAKIAPDRLIGEGTDLEIANALERASKDQNGLHAHAMFATSLRGIEEYRLAPLVEERVRANSTLNNIGELFETFAVRLLAKAVYAVHGHKLARCHGARLNQLRSDLASHDREIIELSRAHLRTNVHASARPPRGNGIGKKSEWTEMALIENEISKKQRFISVRDLTERAGRALLELKPCWMMSPLAVAQYVQRKAITFDLCIIDEASQMPPEAALGALLRCKQTMVVGDTNQLPPTSFFRKMIDEEDADEDETVLNESILEMANATFRPPRRLRWHYRSRHSGLIKFSNRLVYDDNLIVFPSATEALTHMGVEFRSVPGRYKAGTNAIEAKAVVDAALEFMRSDPDRSLGIVTLNQKQRDLITEELEHAIGRDKRAQRYVEDWKERKEGLEEFFIKNLENVQGDERDVIFIGTVYGPEEVGGKVMQRFGPINGLAGRRRLNVLFSRAKQKIVTFSSMTSADIVAEESGNAGAYMLKRWLEYSATGVLDGGTLTTREPDSDFEIFVADQIKAMGCEPVPQVGVAGYFIDIGVKHPSWPYGFILGVECDGASYHSAKSARDRDRLRQEVLEGLGWRFHRVWSTDWFNNPRKEADILRNVIAARLTELQAKEAAFSPRPKIEIAEEAPQPETNDVIPDLFEERIPKDQENASVARANGAASVAVGDTVRVRYISEDKKLVQVTISQMESNPAEGVIHYRTPFAKALLGAEKGEEVEVLVGSYVRQAVVENIIKKAS
jgi:very-short-patch-repair endonuclease